MADRCYACMPGSACRSQHEGDAVFGRAGFELAKICIPGCLRQIHCYMYGVHVHMNKHCYEVREIAIIHMNMDSIHKGAACRYWHAGTSRHSTGTCSPWYSANEGVWVSC